MSAASPASFRFTARRGNDLVKNARRAITNAHTTGSESNPNAATRTFAAQSAQTADGAVVVASLGEARRTRGQSHTLNAAQRTASTDAAEPLAEIENAKPDRHA